ncbi:hypothetical protein ACFLTI_01285 [Bacteroidota bacterium]
MEKIENLLLVGGSYRNVGKTHFIIKLINRFSQNNPIIGLKVKSIYNGDDKFHGRDWDNNKDNFRIIEENKTNTDDGGQMLKAGAKKVFRIKTKIEYLPDAMEDFFNLVPRGTAIIAESNSIRKFFVPGLYIMIYGDNKKLYKPSAIKLSQLADVNIYSDGKSFNISPENVNIDFINGKWDKSKI